MTKQLTIPVLAMTAIMILAAPPDAYAGGGGAEFQAVYDTLTEWVEGILGRIIAVVMVVAGVAIGIARQSIAAFGIGIASALSLLSALPGCTTIPGGPPWRSCRLSAKTRCPSSGREHSHAHEVIVEIFFQSKGYFCISFCAKRFLFRSRGRHLTKAEILRAAHMENDNSRREKGRRR